MKKIIITSFLAMFSICAFSQTTKYELKGWSINGVQKVNADSLSYDIPIIVTVGIVGDTYGFIAPDQNKNMFIVNLPFKVAQTEQAKYTYIKQQAALFVAAQYPDK